MGVEQVLVRLNQVLLGLEQVPVCSLLYVLDLKVVFEAASGQDVLQDALTDQLLTFPPRQEVLAVPL